MDIVDSGNSDSDSNINKTRHSKGKNRVWDKVSWFTKKSRGNRESQTECAALGDDCYHGDACCPQENAEFENDFSSASSLSPVFSRPLSDCSSSSEGEIQFIRSVKAKNYKTHRCLNSEVLYQHCVKPSVVKALFRRECALYHSQKSPFIYNRKTQGLPFNSQQNMPDEEPTNIKMGTVQNGDNNTTDDICHCPSCCSCRQSSSENNFGSWPRKRSCPLKTSLTLSQVSSVPGKKLSSPLSHNFFHSKSHHQEYNSGTSTYMSNRHSRKRPSNSFNGLEMQDLSYTRYEEHMRKSRSLPSGSALNNLLEEFEKLERRNSGMHFLNRFDEDQNHSLPSNTNDYSDMISVNLKRSTSLCNGTKKRLYRSNFFENGSAQKDVESTNHVCQSRRVAVSQNQSNKRIDGKEFKERMEVSLNWFKEFNDQQKNCMMKRLLELCELPQMHMLSVLMEPILHQTCPHNCQDLLSWLPAQLSLHVLSFLDPVSLSACSQVSKVWYELITHPYLWQRLCRLPKWQLSRAEEHKQMINHMSSTIRWKEVFVERYRLRRNWLKGLCSVRTFEGHTEGISCVQFDDTRIVSGSTDSTIKVWNIRTNTPWSVQTLVGHSGTVRCLHLEGNRLVSGSTDRSIKVWDLSMHSRWSSIACRKTMIGHQETVRCLQVDDEKVVSGSYDQTLKVWDIRTGDCRLTLRGHTAAVLCLQFDDCKIISGSADKTIKIWNLTTGVCVMSLEGHHDAVTCLQFDSNKIVSGSLDCNIKFWDIHLGNCTSTLDWAHGEGHTGVVRCLQIDRWRVVSAADDKTLKVWNIETGERLVTLRNHTDGVTCLQFNDSKIVSGSYDRTVKLWDFSSV